MPQSDRPDRPNASPERPPRRDADLSRRKGDDQPAYYDIPLLKPPVWKWEIPAYFFLGGLSAGAFVLSRMAERFGGEKGKGMRRAGTAIACAAYAPCPVLLILDLGDPKRFHYMLRVFKPESPMNLGSWILTGYGGALSLAALEAVTGRSAVATTGNGSSSAKRGELLSMAVDASGVPLGVMLAGYTGVLLSTISTPVWARNPWLGALFSASAFHSGAAALELAHEFGKEGGESDEESHPLEGVNRATRAAEAVALGGYLSSSGPLAKPLTAGKYAPHVWGAAVGAGMILPTLLDRLPVRNKKAKRWLKLAASGLTLAGGFAIKWAVTHAGHPSAEDPDAAREATRRKPEDPGWGKSNP